jgi:uncharacterized protein (TIGR03437 family)
MRFAVAWLLFLRCALAANPPTFNYSSPGINEPNAIATDSAGNTYITGRASSTVSLVTTPGAYQPRSNAGTCLSVFAFAISVGIGPCQTSFVVKLDPTGAVVFATYFGGNGPAVTHAIAVDQQGNVYVAGLTSPIDGNLSSPDTFPVTPGAAFTDPANGSAFITKLNASGSQLVYSTFIPAAENIGALAVDREGNAYITGSTGNGSSFPTTAGAFQVSHKPGSLFPSFVAKLNASGSALSYATYLSGSGGSSGNDTITGIAVDDAGDAFVTGVATSSNFPVTPGAFLTTNPSTESVFITKLNPHGTGLIYSTYLGPGTGNSVKLDAQGTAFVAGFAGALFPTTPGGSTTGSGFLTHLNADGSSLLSSALVPVGVSAMDLDSAGNAVIAATPNTGNLPIGVGAFQPDYVNANFEVYVARYTPAGQFQGGTYLGGSQGALELSFALGPDGSVVVGGLTGGASFVTNFFPSLTVQNAASFAAPSVAPGEIVALRGYGIGPATGVSATDPAFQLGGLTVSFGGYQAPLFYVQANQINAQVPWELAGQTSTTVQISYPGVSSASTPVVLTPSQPGIFYVNNSDGTRNSPSNPAKTGDFIAIYGTGGGPSNPPGLTGGLWGSALSDLTLPVSVVISGQTAAVLYSGSAPTRETGLFQINARIPSSGGTALYVTIGNTSSPAIAVAIQPVAIQ